MYYASGIDYKNTMNNAYRLCVLFNTSELIEQNEAYWLPTDGDNLMCLQVTPRCYETSDFITLFERYAYKSLYTTAELSEIDSLITKLNKGIVNSDSEYLNCAGRLYDLFERSLKYSAYRDLIETAESELEIDREDIKIPVENCFKNGEQRYMNGNDYILTVGEPHYVVFYNEQYTDFGTVGMSLSNTASKFENLSENETPTFDEDGLLFATHTAPYTKSLRECEKFINNLNHRIYTPEEIVTLRSEFNRIKESGNDEWYLDDKNNCAKLISLLDRQAEYEATMKLLRSAEKLGMPEEILWVECYRPELKDTVVIHANEYKQLYQSDKTKNKVKIQKEQ